MDNKIRIVFCFCPYWTLLQQKQSQEIKKKNFVSVVHSKQLRSLVPFSSSFFTFASNFEMHVYCFCFFFLAKWNFDPGKVTYI